MEVYLVQQEWMTRDEHEFNVLGVFDSKEKAKDHLKKLYDEDLKWVIENAEGEDLDENVLQSDLEYSFVQCGDFWSENGIMTMTVE